MSRSIGGLWKHQRMAQEIGVSIYEIKKYLAFIEDSYLLFPVFPYYSDASKEYKAHKEYFFHDI